MSNTNTPTPEQNQDCLDQFEAVLNDRAGGGPSDSNYDPELLMAGGALVDEVKALRLALKKQSCHIDCNREIS